MKGDLFFLCSLFLFSSNVVIAQNNFSLAGKIKGVSTGIIYLSYASVRDSSAIKSNGSFSFNGKVSEPTSAFLVFKQEKSDDNNRTTFFIEPSAMTVSVAYNDFKEAKFTGSKTQKELDLLNKLKAPVQKEIQPLVVEFNRANDMYIKALRNKVDDKTADSLRNITEAIREKFEPFNAKDDSIDYKFFANHPHSYVTAFMLRYHISDLSLDQMRSYYAAFNDKIRQSSYGKELENEIEKLEGGSPGAVAKDFSSVELKGDSVRLSSFRNSKYILLDFWASWCIPCRKGNPHLKDLYGKYKNNDFEIIGVSDDDSSPEKWKKAVKDDSLPWLQVLRGLDWEKIRKGIKNEKDISEKFGIHTLPTKILIDKNGIIIGRYNEDEDDKLDEKLKELFENKQTGTTSSK
ncbi:MAG TPA: TlpA disulfide reductase family protein [Chitinophagaceae bacterium]|nr:TlpA disulfide reductase family protein [Chitinophagaceae bacterium]